MIKIIHVESDFHHIVALGLRRSPSEQIKAYEKFTSAISICRDSSISYSIEAIRMLFAEWFSLFCIKSFSFEVLLTCRTIEALGVPVLVQGLDPAISWFNWELTSVALSLEHRLPIFLAVRFSILNVELSTSYRLAAVEAKEAFGMESVFQCVYALPQNCGTTFATSWSKELLIILLAKELATFLHESYAQERDFTVWV